MSSLSAFYTEDFGALSIISSILDSFTHFNNSLLNPHYMLGTVLQARDTVESKNTATTIFLELRL